MKKKIDNKNEILKAVAINYDEENDSSPKVVAKGVGNVAEKIKDRAVDAGVPITEDSDLVEMLSFVELDNEIPTELYGAVAEILSWVYKANEELLL